MKFQVYFDCQPLNVYTKTNKVVITRDLTQDEAMVLCYKLNGTLNNQAMDMGISFMFEPQTT